MITEEGRRALLGYMTGRYSRWAGAIVLGAGESTTAPETTDVDYPLQISEVDIIVPEQMSRSLVARATFKPQENYKVKEVGLLTDANTYTVQTLATFDLTLDGVTNGALSQEYARVGIESTVLENGGTIVMEGQNQSVGAYSQQARFSLAMHQVDANGTLEVRMGSSELDSYSYVISVSGDGYNVKHWTKEMASASGLANWYDINYMSFEWNGTGEVALDGFIIRPVADSVSSLFVARDVLAAPLQKFATQSMDVEYRVKVNFG